MEAAVRKHKEEGKDRSDEIQHIRKLSENIRILSERLSGSLEIKKTESNSR